MIGQRTALLCDLDFSAALPRLSIIHYWRDKELEWYQSKDYYYFHANNGSNAKYNNELKVVKTTASTMMSVVLMTYDCSAHGPIIIGAVALSYIKMIHNHP